MNESLKFDFSNLDVKTAYGLLTSIVVPRPIAWVTSIHESGKVNLAPFSYFNAVSSNPPVVMISVARKPGGQLKDTASNILRVKEFVVHLTTEGQVAEVNQTSFEYGSHESEVEALGYKVLPSEKISVPRLSHAPIQLECVLEHHFLMGNGGVGSTDIIFGRIQIAHIDSKVMNAAGTVDYLKLRPLARLGGPFWLQSTDVIEQPRPTKG